MTSLQFYNTSARSIVEFTPLQSDVVTIYTCGPTVYDYQHVGNYFTYVREDILVRALGVFGYKINRVMNITDVGHLVSDADEGEDKLEKGAKREGKTAWEVAEFYTERFLEDMQKLNTLAPTHLTKATEHIPEQIALIEKLEKKGYTYKISDGIYFDTSKFPRYGDFAHLDVKEQKEGARVEINPEKRNPTDFALWKFSPTDHKRDMEWDSPWGKGFPGWHIECSAMAMKYLGETIDIHAGGIDHIPVHHTNEIAQSEAATGKQFVRYWFHTNHIMIDGNKIAKSAGNGITIQDIEKIGVPIMAFRLLVLESHYRTQSHFSWETLEAANNRLRSFQAMAVRRWQSASADGLVKKDFDDATQAILEFINNDLNTPQALAEISKLADAVDTRGISDAGTGPYEKFLVFLDQLFGLGLHKLQDIDESAKQLLTEREQARLNKDWASSDDLRNRLQEKGIGIRDTSNGQVWYFI